MNNNITLSREKHKDTTPEETVAKLKQLLSELDIDLTEDWADENEIGTYSLRLSVKGTSIGSNGKGMTRNFARASAYAEFIERLQNNKLAANSTFSNVLFEKKGDFYLFKDEKFLSPEEISANKNSFTKFFFDTRSAAEKEKFSNEAELLRKYHKLDYNIHRKENEFLCLPYYSVRDKKDVYIPYTIQNMFYGSNGMCAGNTPEEALVQGLSEVFERKVQRHLIMDQLSLPDIPESYISKFPDIYEMYKLIKSRKRYNVFIKDGSIGKGYPVCVLIIVEKDTGRFGVKIGSHPDYHIALERLFTEATQGINIESFAKKSVIDFSNTNVSTILNLQNSFKTGDAAYPYQIFSSKPDFEFVEPKDFSSSSNKEMLDYSIELLRKEGCDVLIHDTSYLGFPSYHIIVPGFSEMNIATKNDFEADNTRFHMQKYLSKPEKVDKECVKYLISVINYYQHSLQSNNFKDFSGNLISDKLPGTDVGVDLLYYKSMLYIYIKDYENAYETISLICHIAKSSDAPPEDAEFFYILRNYIHGMVSIGDHDTVIDCLGKLYSEEYVKRIDELFSNSEKVLVKQFRTYNEGEDPESFRKLITVTESYCRCQNIHFKDGNRTIQELFA